jgi:hypothetical protein
MKTTINQVISFIAECKDLNQLVTILELAAHNSGIKTVSEMARSENKSPNGIRSSKAYRKIEIGGQLMCIKGLRDTDLPF